MLLASASETLMPWCSASCSTHWPWIRNCITSPLIWSYWLLHWSFSFACEGRLAPFGSGCLCSAATQLANWGGSGAAAPAPCAWLLDAVRYHLSKSCLGIVVSPTL